MAGIGDLVANLSVNSSGFTRGLSASTSSLNSFAASALGPLAAVAAGYLTINTAISAMSSSMTAAREAAKITAKFESVTEASGNAAGLTAVQYDVMAKSLQKATNFDDDAATNAMAALAKFGTISGEQFKRALPLAADLAAVMDTDIASAAQSLGKALSDPERGMVSLEKSVGRFTTSQRELIQGFVDTNDIASAQGAIMDALSGKVEGAAARMSDPVTRLGNAFGNVEEAAGNAFNAMVDGALNGGAIEALDSMASSVSSLENAFKILGESLAQPGGFIAQLTNAANISAALLKLQVSGTDTEFVMKNGLLAPVDNMLPGMDGAGGGPVLDGAKQAAADAVKAAADIDKMFAEWDEMPVKGGKRKRPQRPEMEDAAGVLKDFGLDSHLRLGNQPEKKIGGSGQSQFAGALEQGSQAAYSAFVQAMGAGSDSKIAREQLSIAKEQLKLMKKTGINQNTPNLTVIERLA